LNNVEKGINVRLSSSVLENLEVAQRMLLKLGIFGTIYKNRRREQFKEMPDGNVSIYIDGDVFVANRHVVKLARSVPVREAMKKSVDVLSRDGIDTFEIGSGIDEPVTLTKEDKDYLNYELLESEEILVDEIRTMGLNIISLSFKDTNKWRVSYGSESFFVTIEDEDFLHKVNNSEVSFSKNDFIICEVRERQMSSVNGLRLDRVIVRVIEHRTALKQAGLF
jgi:hypothetical protein